MVFGLHEYRPIYRFSASAVKVMRPILTREFFPINFGILYSPVLNTGKIPSQYTAPASSLWRPSWCRSRHTWKWESRVMSSPRMSSRNSPKSVLSEDCFLFSVVGLCPRMYWHRIVLPPLLLFEEARFYPHREGNGFTMHAWRFTFVPTLFESCKSLIRDISR